MPCKLPQGALFPPRGHGRASRIAFFASKPEVSVFLARVHFPCCRNRTFSGYTDFTPSSVRREVSLPFDWSFDITKHGMHDGGEVGT